MVKLYMDQIYFLMDTSQRTSSSRRCEEKMVGLLSAVNASIRSKRVIHGR